MRENSLPSQARPGELQAPTGPGTDPAPEPYDPIKHKPLWEIFPDWCLNPDAPIAAVSTWLKIGGRPAIPKTGVVSLSGKPKTGKSMAAMALPLALLDGREWPGVEVLDRPRLVLYFDCEMSRATLQIRQQMMYRALGSEAPRFVPVPLKTSTLEERRNIVDTLIKATNPDMVIIDPISQFCRDFNDVSECTEVRQWLDSISEDRTVVVVIHQNKAKDNNQMRGHLGSRMEEMADENYSVTTDGAGGYSVKVESSRETDITGAQPFRFKMDGEQGITPRVEEKKTPEALEQERREDCKRWRGDFSNLFRGDRSLANAELVERIQNRQRLSRSSALRKIKNALQSGALEKSGEGRQYYRLAGGDGSVGPVDG